jgi:sorbitol-specific phosphotransferase system component IIC
MSLMFCQRLIACVCVDPNEPVCCRKVEQFIDTATKALCKLNVIYVLIVTGIIHLLLITLYGIVSVINFLARRRHEREKEGSKAKESV